MYITNIKNMKRYTYTYTEEIVEEIGGQQYSRELHKSTWNSDTLDDFNTINQLFYRIGGRGNSDTYCSRTERYVIVDGIPDYNTMRKWLTRDIATIPHETFEQRTLKVTDNTNKQFNDYEE